MACLLEDLHSLVCVGLSLTYAIALRNRGRAGEGASIGHNAAPLAPSFEMALIWRQHDAIANSPNGKETTMLSKLKSAFTIAAAVAAMTAALVGGATAQSGTPIKIGFGMAMTGGLAANGKSALLAQKIWEEEVNAKGGLLGRPVKLIYYDDQSNPSTVPNIYTKLLDVDKVDLIIGGYATAQVAPAMPVVIGKGKVLIGLFALDANHDFHYPKYFSMLPSGPTPKASFTEGFFEIAAAQNPKPQTVAITAEDAEFSRNA